MTRIIKLHRGLDISLAGKAEELLMPVERAHEYALLPSDFIGVKPRPVVKEGDKVKAGDALFVNKDYPEVRFAAPVSGTVTTIERGERRKLLSIRIEADEQQEYRKFAVSDETREKTIESLLEAGLFGYINQLPYAISTNPQTMPRAIFVSAFRDMPLAGNFEFELRQGNKQDFQRGLTALSKIAKVYLGISINAKEAILTTAKNVEIIGFSGKCPAGNVGVQINHIAPINKGEVVWTVDPTAVIFFGRLFNTGKVDLRRIVAVAGSEVERPSYRELLVGESIAKAIPTPKEGTRIIMGNPLTGTTATAQSFLGAHTSEITMIPEGDNADELLGWIMPRTKQFSVNRSYFSWLMPKKEYTLDARIKGGERHMIMSGEYDRVLPMDIYGEYLVKAIIAKDIDKMEQLGIYEVSPEDFALAEFVDSSKLELQRIVREGLDLVRKENE